MPPQHSRDPEPRATPQPYASPIATLAVRRCGGRDHAGVSAAPPAHQGSIRPLTAHDVRRHEQMREGTGVINCMIAPAMDVSGRGKSAAQVAASPHILV